MIDWKNCKDAINDNQYCDKGVEGCGYCDDMDYVLTYEKEYRKCEDFGAMNKNAQKHVEAIYKKRGQEEI